MWDHYDNYCMLAILQVCNLHMYMPVGIFPLHIWCTSYIATYYSRFHHSIYYGITMTTTVCCRQLEMEVKAGGTVLSIFFFLVT